MAIARNALHWTMWRKKRKKMIRKERRKGRRKRPPAIEQLLPQIQMASRMLLVNTMNSLFKIYFLVNLNQSNSAATCPAHLRNASNPGCSSNCLRHSDCAQRSPHMRCCPFGCGQQCQFPEKLSPLAWKQKCSKTIPTHRCVHLLATTLREVDKLAKLPETLGRPTVQCTAEGHFEPVQFDALTGFALHIDFPINTTF